MWAFGDPARAGAAIFDFPFDASESFEKTSASRDGRSVPESALLEIGPQAGAANRRVELYVSCCGFEVPRRRSKDEYAKAPEGFRSAYGFQDADADLGSSDDDDDDDIHRTDSDDDDDDEDDEHGAGFATLRAALLRQVLRGVQVPRRVLEHFLLASGDDAEQLNDLEQLLLATGRLNEDDDPSDPDDRVPPDDSSDDDSMADRAEVHRLETQLSALADDATAAAAADANDAAPPQAPEA